MKKFYALVFLRCNAFVHIQYRAFDQSLRSVLKLQNILLLAEFNLSVNWFYLLILFNGQPAFDEFVRILDILKHYIS